MVWVVDSEKLPFYQAEKYHQFHNGCVIVYALECPCEGPEMAPCECGKREESHKLGRVLREGLSARECGVQFVLTHTLTHLLSFLYIILTSLVYQAPVPH